jgi:hypothetical protein
MNVSWLLVARDGGILALGACALIAGLLRFNPRLFLRHFPEAVQRALPPKTRTEKRHSIIGGIALLTWTIGVLSVSAAAAELRGTVDYLSLAIHTFAVGMVFNLADWLILDELWIGLLRPRWLVPAGVDPATIPFEHVQHFRAFLRGAVIFAVLGAAIALGIRMT